VEKIEESLLGTWIWTKSSTHTEFTIDGDDLLYFLITNHGFTGEEAELFEDGLLSNHDSTSGSITFNKDYTYVSSIDGMGPFDGTWSVSKNGDTIIYDQGTMYEMQMVIINLTAYELVLHYPPDSIYMDLDGDQVDDTTITALTVITLSKS
jgi:hypothetical protein